MKKLLVTGAGGQLSTEYERSLPLKDWEFLFLDKKTLDISKYSQIEEILNMWEFDAILNLAAYTDIDKAEKKELESAYNCNSLGVKNLAIACKIKNIPLIHISTSYVFDGTSESFYTEESEENPINQYGRTKFIGEKWIQENTDWYYIIRTSWLYSNHSKNFYSNIIELAQERNELNINDDEFSSPTSTKEMCRAIDAVLINLDKSKSGTYHFTCLGKTTLKNFAIEIFNQIKVPIIIHSSYTENTQSKVNKPKNVYMISEKFKQAFLYTPLHWKNALQEIVDERKTIPIKVGNIVSANNKELVIVSTDWMKKLAKLAPLHDINHTIELPFDMITLNN